MYVVIGYFVFFFKQKTADEMRISDWSSDVCSSDLFTATNPHFASNALQTVGQRLQDAHTRIQELSTEEVEQRVARAILRLVDQSGLQTPEGIDRKSVV